MTVKRLYERGEESQSTEDELIDRFYAILQEKPQPIVFKCSSCKKVRKTSKLNDPAALRTSITCEDADQKCYDESSTPQTTPLTAPVYAAGSFVSVILENGAAAPGMIDFVPDRHPEVVHKAFCDESAEEERGHYVSFLSDFDEPFSGGWFPFYRLAAVAPTHKTRIQTAENLAKFNMCLETRFTPLKDRLFKYSYFAHKHRLYPPKLVLSKYTSSSAI